VHDELAIGYETSVGHRDVVKLISLGPLEQTEVDHAYRHSGSVSDWSGAIGDLLVSMGDLNRSPMCWSRAKIPG